MKARSAIGVVAYIVRSLSHEVCWTLQLVCGRVLVTAAVAEMLCDAAKAGAPAREMGRARAAAAVSTRRILITSGEGGLFSSCASLTRAASRAGLRRCVHAHRIYCSTRVRRIWCCELFALTDAVQGATGS